MTKLLQLDKLNQQQEYAVKNVEGPMLILAGAGSGKTRVLTNKIVYIVKNKYVPSLFNIFAVTFTNKAAKEMIDRILRHFPAFEYEYRRLWISTFHSLALRILRYEIANIPYKDNFVIYDVKDANNILKGIIKQFNIDEKRYNINSYSKAISDIKNNLENNFSNYDNLYKLQEVYESYNKALLSNNAMDFDDILLNAVKLFIKYPEILNKYQEKFKYILVDEYQDINDLQYKLVYMLANKHKNITVVGDDDQSIYAFRGSKIEHILNFRQDFPDCKVVKLEENYRSNQNILEIANSVISKNTNRYEKVLYTSKKSNELARLFEAYDEKQEASRVASEISKLVFDGKYEFKDIAILYRTNSLSRVFEEFLLKDGIPYRIVGGFKFYDRKEIKDIVAYLRFVVNPNDYISFSRIINTPPRRIGEITLSKIVALANEYSGNILLALKNLDKINSLTGQQKKNLKDFYLLISDIRDNLFSDTSEEEKYSIKDVISIIFEMSGYEQYLKGMYSEGLERRNNVLEFLSVAEEFSDRYDTNDLNEFLSYISLMTDQDQLQGQENKVSLMTVHAAKGLEFPVVFIVGMEEGLFPHSLSLDEPLQLEEERRLFYVAITRAKDLLYITYSDNRMIYGERKTTMKSSFLSDIPEELYRQLDSQDLYVNREFVPFSKFKSNRNLRLGDKVRHPVFGEGIVMKRGSSKFSDVVILFTDSKKMVKLGYREISSLEVLS